MPAAARARRRAAPTSTSRTRSPGRRRAPAARARARPTVRCGAAAARSSRASPDENFSQKVNRKMYRAGIASILSQLHREGRLSVIDALAVEAPKTKLFARKVKALGFPGTLLIVIDKFDDNVFLVVAQSAGRAGARDAGDRSGEPRALQPRAAHQGAPFRNSRRCSDERTAKQYNPERLARAARAGRLRKGARISRTSTSR